MAFNLIIYNVVYTIWFIKYLSYFKDPPWRSHIWKMKANTEDKPKRLRKRVYFSDIARFKI